MKRKSRFLAAALGAGTLMVVQSSTAAPKLKPEELIAKHLESLGGSSLAAVGRLVASGSAAAVPRVGGSGRIEGKATIDSGGDKWLLEMIFDNPQYPHEKIGFDGERADVAQLRPGARSPLGNLLYTQDRPITEGLFGGVLSTRWALLHVPQREAKIKYKGTKKVDGRQLHLLEYSPRKGTDFRIRLYFDADHFRHVRSEYQLTIAAASVKLTESSTQAEENRFEIVEEFSDFRSEGKFTLPHAYKIRYGAHGQRSVVIDYEMTFDQFRIE